MCDSCKPIFSWEMIDATDMLFFKTPESNQGLHRVYVSRGSFESLDQCFENVFDKMYNVFKSKNSTIALYQHHDRKKCCMVQRRYLLESTDSLLITLKKNSNFLRNMCYCSGKKINSCCQLCLDRMLDSEVPYPGPLCTLLYNIMSRQTEWSTWYLSARNDNVSHTDEIWSGAMVFSHPRTTAGCTCLKKKYKDYILYTLAYNKQKLNKFTPRCNFCRVPTRFVCTFCRECYPVLITTL